MAPSARTAHSSDEIKRLARALSAVKRRLNNPKLPNDACYAGVAYKLPDPPMLAARLLFEALGPLASDRTLDRVDPNGDYALANMRYATRLEQTANRRPHIKRPPQGEEEWEDD
jgi:hypothetical protein